MEKCEVNAQKIEQIEKRVSKLEENREKDKNQVYELDKSLNVFINEMKNISSELKTIVSNFKEAIIRSTNAQEKELMSLKEKVLEQGHRIEKLDAKLEHETVEVNAQKWKDISKYVITAIIGGVITFLFVQIGLK